MKNNEEIKTKKQTKTQMNKQLENNKRIKINTIHSIIETNFKRQRNQGTIAIRVKGLRIGTLFSRAK